MNTMGGGVFAHSKILGAVLLATVLIVGAYVIARDVETPQTAQASSEKALLQEIAKRDTDSDGLPDWQETLFGTDPTKRDTRGLGMTDGEAVAKGLIVPPAVADLQTASSSSPLAFDPSLPVPAEGTITRTVSESFFTKYIVALDKSATGVLTQEQMKAIIDAVFEELTQAIIPAPDLASINSLTKTGSSEAQMRVFAAEAEAVFIAHKMYVTTEEETRKSEIDYLSDALEKGDTQAYQHILAIAKLYQDTAAGLVKVPVPEELASVDLLLINSLARLGRVTQDLARTDSDPIVAMLALRQYPEAIRALGTAFIRLNAAYRTKGIAFGPDESGAHLVGLVERLAADQQSAQASTLQP